jgi:hypothetical protein
MSTNFLYAHAYCGISVRDIGTHVSKVCNASKICVMLDLICVTSFRSFLSSFARSVTAVSWRSTACSILPPPFTSFTGFKSSLACCFLLLVLFSVLRIFVHPLLLAPIMGSHVSGCMAANRLIETVIAPNFVLERSTPRFSECGVCAIFAGLRFSERMRSGLLDSSTRR